MSNLKLEVSNKVESPKLGAKFWTFYKNEKSGFVQVLEATYDGGLVDTKRVQQGRVYTTQAEAKKAAFV